MQTSHPRRCIGAGILLPRLAPLASVLDDDRDPIRLRLARERQHDDSGRFLAIRIRLLNDSQHRVSEDRPGSRELNQSEAFDPLRRRPRPGGAIKGSSGHACFGYRLRKSFRTC